MVDKNENEKHRRTTQESELKGKKDEIAKQTERVRKHTIKSIRRSSALISPYNPNMPKSRKAYENLLDKLLDLPLTVLQEIDCFISPYTNHDGVTINSITAGIIQDPQEQDGVQVICVDCNYTKFLPTPMRIDLPLSIYISPNDIDQELYLNRFEHLWAALRTIDGNVTILQIGENGNPTPLRTEDTE